MRRRAADALEVEPVDLEPIVVEPAPATPRPVRARRPKAWIFAVAAVAVLWAGIAFATRHTPTHAASPAPAPPALAAASGPLPASFIDSFAGVGTGRFAAVVNGTLYTIDANAHSSTPVDLGVDAEPATIEDQSGRELLVRTKNDNVIVDTTGLGTMSIPIDRSAISSHDGNWWFVGSSRDVSRYDVAAAVRIPPGIDLLGSLGNGFIVAANHGFALWTRGDDTTRPIAPGATKLLTTNKTAAVFRATCEVDAPCDEIVHSDGTLTNFDAPFFAEPASLSPDESELVSGNAVFATTTGRVVAAFTLPVMKVPLPYAWTSDGTLLLALDGAVGVLHPGDRDVNEIIGLNGLTQIAALP
jgi:hypothetical protein